MFKLVLGKAEEPEIKLPTSAGSWKKDESSRKTSISALLTMPKPLTVWITINCGKILKEMGIPDHLTCLLRNLCAGQEATVRTGQNNRLVPNRERSTSRLYIVTLLIYLLCRVHHAKCLAGWITSWNQDFQQKYQQPQICGWYHSNGRRQRGIKEPLDEGKERRVKKRT